MHSDLPKVLQPLAGKPLLRHVVDAALALDPQSIHVVHGHGGDAVRAAMSGLPLDWALQADQRGTGHALMQALPAIPDDHGVMVLYGDVPLIQPPTLRALADACARGALALLTAELADPAGYGRILRDSAGRVTAIVEDKDAGPQERSIHEVNTGLLAAPAARLREWLIHLRPDNSQGEYYLTDVVHLAVQAGNPVETVGPADETEILGVNDKCQLAVAESAYRRARTRELMLHGATLVDPTRVDVRGDVRLGRDVFIDVGAVLIGPLELGDQVTVGPYCVLRDTKIGAGTLINPHSVIEGAKIGARCIVGPYARLRPGADVHDDAHVGNFVELKNTELGAGSKANHLSYLGDARIGRNVNVGAGTITCNYDGANKWPTTIGDGAFIGSGSMLVAPVSIGAGATIGAGSTITASAPEGKLTLTRAKQTTHETWTPPRKAADAERSAKIAAAAPKKPKS